MIVFAVIQEETYDRCFEIDSLWFEKEEAERRASDMTGLWQVSPMTVQGAPSLRWESEKLPPDETWCWVSNDERRVWLAKREKRAVGGWTNEDTWEDWDGNVKFWIPIEKPEPSK